MTLKNSGTWNAKIVCAKWSEETFRNDLAKVFSFQVCRSVIYNWIWKRNSQKKKSADSQCNWKKWSFERRKKETKYGWEKNVQWRQYDKNKRFVSRFYLHGLQFVARNRQLFLIINYWLIKLDNPKMVTTIKITCDGVFIHTNLQDTLPNQRRTLRNNGMERAVHFAVSDADTAINKTSITVDDVNTNGIIGDKARPSPIITSISPDSTLFSPILVASSLKTLLCSQQSSNSNESVETVERSMPSTHKICRIERSNGNGKYIFRSINSCSNGKCSDRAIRRRNTFKSYLLECKEHLVRRMSSPTPLIG